ncbi:rRNA maturation RNase YbeY [Cytophagales bacterium LB-30]|uniref:Endoribonuclease YbeY n=1 Tax=Shiella aurantiaca TaxID=3058365 RepID=A0ABT8F5E3_9BACT|nr:rRNA maturation RNase YbeY [Shiella aurantiaca]MDN4165589.1 rRNA maturation RNase YbeY [Shiella aurantiaca]
MAVHFFTEDIAFKIKSALRTKQWIKEVVQQEGKKLKEVNYIFCSDEHLLGINQEYLQHDTYTDIITFDNSETDKEIEGDIYISIDRVKENANTLNIPFEEELRRVLIHGILHLIGYGDKSAADKKQMREMENQSLARFDVPRETLK